MELGLADIKVGLTAVLVIAFLSVKCSPAVVKCFSARRARYASMAYWEKRYASNTAKASLESMMGTELHEWYIAPEQIMPVCLEVFPDRSAIVLDVGCGNSNVCGSLLDAGFARAVGVDWAQNVIEQMRRQAAVPDALPARTSGT